MTGFKLASCGSDFGARYQDDKIIILEIEHPNIGSAQMGVNKFELEIIIDKLIELLKDTP